MISAKLQNYTLTTALNDKPVVSLYIFVNLGNYSIDFSEYSHPLHSWFPYKGEMNPRINTGIILHQEHKPCWHFIEQRALKKKWGDLYQEGILWTLACSYIHNYYRLVPRPLSLFWELCTVPDFGSSRLHKTTYGDPPDPLSLPQRKRSGHETNYQTKGKMDTWNIFLSVGLLAPIVRSANVDLLARWCSSLNLDSSQY